MKVLYAALLLVSVYVCDAKSPWYGNITDSLSPKLDKTRRSLKNDRYKPILCKDSERCQAMKKSYKLHLPTVIFLKDDDQFLDEIKNSKKYFFSYFDKTMSFLQMVPVFMVDHLEKIAKDIVGTSKHIFHKSVTTVNNLDNSSLLKSAIQIGLVKKSITAGNRLIQALESKTETATVDMFIQKIKENVFSVFLLPVETIVWLYNFCKDNWSYADTSFWKLATNLSKMAQIIKTKYNIKFVWSMNTLIVGMIVSVTVLIIFYMFVSFSDLIVQLLIMYKTKDQLLHTYTIL